MVLPPFPLSLSFPKSAQFQSRLHRRAIFRVGPQVFSAFGECHRTSIWLRIGRETSRWFGTLGASGEFVGWLVVFAQKRDRAAAALRPDLSNLAHKCVEDPSFMRHTKEDIDHHLAVSKVPRLTVQKAPLLSQHMTIGAFERRAKERATPVAAARIPNSDIPHSFVRAGPLGWDTTAEMAKTRGGLYCYFANDNKKPRRISQDARSQFPNQRGGRVGAKSRAIAHVRFDLPSC